MAKFRRPGGVDQEMLTGALLSFESDSGCRVGDDRDANALELACAETEDDM